jgi:hypothetical protein
VSDAAAAAKAAQDSELTQPYSFLFPLDQVLAYYHLQIRLPESWVGEALNQVSSVPAGSIAIFFFTYYFLC